jgi:predicted DNA-binding antitoxin AbrB/MazE fold protein
VFFNWRRKMAKIIKARFSQGMIKPLEKVDIAEGAEMTIQILQVSSEPKRKSFRDALDETFGGWKELIDCDELKRNIYADRRRGIPSEEQE